MRCVHTAKYSMVYGLSPGRGGRGGRLVGFIPFRQPSQIPCPLQSEECLVSVQVGSS